VLQGVALDQAGATRSRPNWLELLRHPLQLVPRIAVAALALGLGMFSYQRYEVVSQAKMAESVAVVSRVSSLPGPDVLQDFEAVRCLTRTPAADGELLALLQ
jgi:hypothetical protein